MFKELTRRTSSSWALDPPSEHCFGYKCFLLRDWRWRPLSSITTHGDDPSLVTSNPSTPALQLFTCHVSARAQDSSIGTAGRILLPGLRFLHEMANSLSLSLCGTLGRGKSVGRTSLPNSSAIEVCDATDKAQH